MRSATRRSEPARETAQSTISTAPSREIAEAWRDGVINPFLMVMTREQQLLESGVLEWERYGKYIKGLFYAGGRATYSGLEEEFYEIHADIKKEIDNHNALVAELTTRKESLFLAVAESPYLLNAYKEATSPSALQDLREKYRHEIGRYETDEALLQGMLGSLGAEPDEHLKIFAVYVVNNAGDLPSNYTTHPIWNTHKGSFLEVLSYPPASAEKLLVDQARERLRGCVESLINQLKKVRREICRHHGIPVEEPSRGVPDTGKWL